MSHHRTCQLPICMSCV